MDRSPPDFDREGHAVPSILGTGLVALDFVFKDGVFFGAWAGGTCGNVLTALALLGWHSYPIARLSMDAAGERVKADLGRWHVRADFLSCPPAAATPIVVENLTTSAEGHGHHAFSWNCPRCGAKLPRHKPITEYATDAVGDGTLGSSVFFMDRLSPASLALATRARSDGALVMWELAAERDPALLDAALAIVHILKYARERAALVPVDKAAIVDLEICTLGENGLRFRSSLPNAATAEWTSVSGFRPNVVVDPCGAGDWCTAGLLSAIGVGGYAAFKQLSHDELLTALRYSQAMAAWSCAFVGPRGGMYTRTRQQLLGDVRAIIAGDSPPALSTLSTTKSMTQGYGCPLCSERDRGSQQQ